jgi:hypothetical protein
VEDKTKTYAQEVLALARLAEAQDHSIDYGPDYQKAHKENCISDLNEGVLPYRPRYICPDYSVLLKKGSRFLNLEPAKNLYDACNNLLILYHNVPSITSFPVYLGQIDDLLEPFVTALPREEAKAELKRLSSYLHTREEFRRVLNHSRIMTMPPYRVAISKAFREASAFLRICRFQG